jgi:hypothetical protein
MNNVQRRLFRRYVDGGGDLTNAKDVESMVRSVQTTMVLLPPRVRAALELALNAAEDTTYAALAATLSAQSGEHVTVSAFRQRISRGMWDLEQAITLPGRPGDGGESKPAADRGRGATSRRTWPAPG